MTNKPPPMPDVLSEDEKLHARVEGMLHAALADGGVQLIGDDKYRLTKHGFDKVYKMIADAGYTPEQMKEMSLDEFMTAIAGKDWKKGFIE